MKIALKALVLAGLVSTGFSSIARAHDVNADKMVEAIFSGDVKEIKALKAKGVSLDAVSASNNTGLMQLADEGRLDGIKKALSLGAKVDAQNRDKQTALFAAVGSGHTEVVTYLISKGAKVNLVDSSKECPLHLAARSEVVPLATKLKALSKSCLTQKNDEGKTPADIATGLGNAELAKLLKP